MLLSSIPLTIHFMSYFICSDVVSSIVFFNMCSSMTILFTRNSSDIHFSTYSFWFVKIHMGPIKSCEFHINLVGPMWILNNQKECVEKCVLECVLLSFLIIYLVCCFLGKLCWPIAIIFVFFKLILKKTKTWITLICHDDGYQCCCMWDSLA